MKKTIFLAIAIAVVCSCNKNQIEQTIDNSATSDSTISFDADVSENLTKSGEKEMIPFASEEIEGSYSASLQVMPIGAMADTKATINTGSNEITRTTLKTSGFYVDGYLDPSTEEYAGDTERDGNNGIFYAKHTTFNEDLRDCAHTVHNDGHWVFEGTAPQWRDLSDHHFWAYYPKQTFTESAYNAVSFDYTSNNTDDLVMAHHEQYWEMHDDADNHGTNDELWCLNFKHPLAAVHLTKNFTFLAATDASEKSYEPAPDRFEVSVFNMMGYKSGSCEVSDYDKDIKFKWTVKNTDSKVTLCQADADGASYVIPQATGDIILPINVLDKGTGVSKDDTWFLPSTDAIQNWVPGFYYNYKYNATFIGPYVDPDNPGSYDPGFTGSPWQAAAPVGTINFSYVKDMTISWTNIPGCNNQWQEVYVIITPDEIPITPNAKKDNRPEITNQDSGPSLVDGAGEILLLKTTATAQGVVSVHYQGVPLKWRQSGQEAWTEVTGTATATGKEDLKYDIQINIDADALELEGRQYIYLVYKGGNESGWMNWNIEDFTVSIDSRRTPKSE